MMRSGLLVRLGLLAALALFGFTAWFLDARVAHADLFIVDTLDDEPDANPGNGTCRISFSLRCSLRAAIQEANARAGQDSIVLPSGTLTLTRGALPEINGSLTITGQGSGSSRVGNLDTIAVFRTADATGTVLRVTGVELRGAQRGLLCETGTTCFLTSARVTAMTVNGVLNRGTLTIANSVIEGNTTATSHQNNGAAGVYNLGGTITIDSSTIRNNTITANGATRAAGILTDGGQGSIIASTISGNTAVLPPGFVTSTAGGLFNTGNLTIVNSTVSGNTGTGGGPGGIQTANNLLTLRNVTIANNLPSGLRKSSAAGDIRMQNTILAGNGALNCDSPVPADPDVQKRQNLESGATCGLTVNDRSNTDPKLGPLQDNGGPTQTHALLSGSPALEEANCVVATDQRGSLRPADGDGNGDPRCDIGAFERGVPIGLNFPIPPLGVPGLSPGSGTAGVGRAYPVTFRWDVPEPLNWGSLDTLDLRVRADGQVIFGVRWDQPTDLFQLLDNQGQPLGVPYLAGTPIILGEGAVKLDLGGVQSQTNGVSGRNVILTLPLIFGETLQGKTLALEVTASGDAGNRDPYTQVGTVTVESLSVPAPSATPVVVIVEPVKEDQPSVRKPTETEKAQQQRTNRLGLDDHRVEGNVLRLRTEPGMIEVIIANRDGEVTLKLRGEALEVGKHVQPGQYVVGRGEKEHEQLYWIDDLNIDR